MYKIIATITAPTGDVMEIVKTTNDPFAQDFSGACHCTMRQNGVYAGGIEEADAMNAIAGSRAAGYIVVEG